MPRLTDHVSELLRTVFARMIPERRVILPADHRQLEAHLAHTLTADRLHGILREAEAGNTRRLFALYRDVLASDDSIQSDFSTRKLAVLGEPAAVQPFDKKVAADVRAADEIKWMLDDLPRPTERYKELLDATLYPVVLMQKEYRAASRKGLRYQLAGLHHVEPQLLDWTAGGLRIEEVDPATHAPRGSYLVPDATRFITHRGHLLTTPDTWGGPMRSILFWWLFSAMDRDWWVRFLERYGAPFIVGKYDQADDASRLSLQRAFGAATRLFGLVVSRETDVELVGTNSSQGGDAFAAFQDYAAKRKSKLILGQTLATNSDPTGIGSGASGQHGQVREDLRRWDALSLGATLRDQLFTQYLRINGISGRAPHITFGGEAAEDAAHIGALLTSMTGAGLELTDEAVEVLGQRLGYGIRRRAAVPVTAGATTLFSADTPATADMDAVARAGGADLAQAFRGDLAPVRRLIMDSTSAEDLERKIRLFFADWTPARSADVIAQALTAYAANGLGRMGGPGGATEHHVSLAAGEAGWPEYQMTHATPAAVRAIYASWDLDDLEQEAESVFGEVPDLDADGLRLLLGIYRKMSDVVLSASDQPRDSRGRFVSSGRFAGHTEPQLRTEAKTRFGSQLPKIKDAEQLRNLLDLHHQMAGDAAPKAAKKARTPKAADPAKVSAIRQSFTSARELAHKGQFTASAALRGELSKHSKPDLDGAMAGLGLGKAKTKKAAVDRLLETVSTSQLRAWRR